MKTDPSHPLFHWEHAHVKGYDCDVHQQVSLPALIQMMHEAAMQHVLKLKVSAKELAPQHLAWVLYQEQLEFFRRPTLGEPVNILTHPSGKERVFTYRDFHVYDVQDQLLAQASSTWLLMDTQRRRIARYPESISDLLTPSNELPQLDRCPKLKQPTATPLWTNARTVAFHDLDFNEHLSNIHYFRWMLDVLPHEILQGQVLQKFQISFQEECNLGDLLEIAAWEVGEKQYHHRIRLGEKVKAMAVSYWE